MNLLIEFENTWDWKDKFTSEEWAEIREGFPTLPIELPTDHWYGRGTHLLTSENVDVAAKFALNFRVAESVAKGGVGQMIVKLQDRIRSLELGQEDMGTLIAKGAAVQIHVPDLVLMGYDKVMHLDDACTDELQEQLDDGWRILAVCPPNAARRPDYILGRNSREGER